MDVIRPRRPHHKSRTGCLQCKSRKVKCDEKKPSCQKCQSYGSGSECSYLRTHPMKSLHSHEIQCSTMMRQGSKSKSPASDILPSKVELSPRPAVSPTPSLSASSYSFSTLDMELLHYYTVYGVSDFIDFASGQELYRTTVVELAFQFPFLMHEILALAALQLSHARPLKAAYYHEASTAHLTTALQLFQDTVSNLTAENFQAHFAFTTMMFTFAWTSQDSNLPNHLFFGPECAESGSAFPHSQWVKLYRGSNFILKNTWESLSRGPFKVVLDPWIDFQQDYIPPLDPADDVHVSSLSNAWSSTSSCDLPLEQRQHLDHALNMLKRVYGLLRAPNAPSPLSAVMSWFSSISDEVEAMLGRKVKEALLLVAYYCVCVHRVSHVSWMSGKGKNLLQTTLNVLGPGWEEWTAWPIEVVLGREWRGGKTMSVDFISGASS
ncbi:hypothetical protein BCIN_05g04220 [Botrytis cinerea B05.10]|uniref:Zn(2)-C6 fungal-type domain-containing protein n=3 Tax=Botryotinia fuckeliana TaxID=40559 RepID=A0A384JHW4_BOTFB|nr:hypothetical protein BCIN_05g04220 [Botrytis cinerea B05.10]ATZ50032.1 hypothetical protein BCIN_05g04220 [Botrytis cinerea B05.10]CCD46435.1 similar to transcription factor Cys6 [Botrytis cinerea T4]